MHRFRARASPSGAAPGQAAAGSDARSSLASILAKRRNARDCGLWVGKKLRRYVDNLFVVLVQLDPSHGHATRARDKPLIVRWSFEVVSQEVRPVNRWFPARSGRERK